MFTCPNCEVSLERVSGPLGLFWRCSSCEGRSLTTSLLRKVAPRKLVLSLWRDARAGKRPRKRACPACSSRMSECPVPAPSGEVILDICTACHLIWFDPTEFGKLPRMPDSVSSLEEKPEEKASLRKARERLALSMVKRAATKGADPDWGSEAPEEFWKWIPGLLGMPVEFENVPVQRRPLATWIVTLVVVTVSCLAFLDLRVAVETFGLIPAQLTRYGGLTLITSFFLHGGILHLIGNMYFFLVFGDNVEDYLGRWRFLVVLLLSTFVGDVAHIAGDPSSTVPCIGASGGISGIITYYALKFPRARLGMLFRIYYRFWWIRVPAYALFILWVALQLFGVSMQLSGYSNVSALAHLGGAATGLFFWLMTRKSG